MPLDSDLVRLDKKGIFPAPGESEEQFFKRGTAISTKQPTTAREVITALHNSYGTEHAESLHDPEKRFPKLYDKFRQRYGCDLGWVPVFYADLGNDDPLGEIVHGVASAYMLLDGQRNIVRTGAAFVAIDYWHYEKRSLRRTLFHELTHFPRGVAFGALAAYRDEAYLQRRKAFEERLASSETLVTAIGSLWEDTVNGGQTGLRGYLKFKMRMRLDFGDKTGYVMIRIPYEEAVELYQRSTKRPRTILYQKAEEGDLRYQIMKERMKLS